MTVRGSETAIGMLPAACSHDVGAAVVAAARAWIGTPYRHQASVRGVGADCLGLVRGVYRDVTGCAGEAPPPYTRDWGETNSAETLIAAALRHLTPVAIASRVPGDVLVFRLRPGAVAKHMGILSKPDWMIHAMEGTAASEVPFAPWWQRRVAAVFRFPS